VLPQSPEAAGMVDSTGWRGKVTLRVEGNGSGLPHRAQGSEGRRPDDPAAADPRKERVDTAVDAALSISAAGTLGLRSGS
jgi:hypothetical protein